MQRIFDEIRMCLKNECYIAALALALTLPDICGKAEYPKGGSKKRYKKWFVKYVKDYRNRVYPVTEEHSSMPHLTVEDFYDIRCALLHQGSVDTEKKKNIRKLFLVINENHLIKEAVVGTHAASYWIRPSIICDAIVEAAEEYYINNKEKFDFVQINLYG